MIITGRMLPLHNLGRWGLSFIIILDQGVRFPQIFKVKSSLQPENAVEPYFLSSKRVQQLQISCWTGLYWNFQPGKQSIMLEKISALAYPVVLLLM